MVKFSEWIKFREEDIRPTSATTSNMAPPQPHTTLNNAAYYASVSPDIITKIQATGTYMPKILDRANQLMKNRMAQTMSQALTGAMGEYQKQQYQPQQPMQQQFANPQQTQPAQSIGY